MNVNLYNALSFRNIQCARRAGNQQTGDQLTSRKFALNDHFQAYILDKKRTWGARKKWRGGDVARHEGPRAGV